MTKMKPGPLNIDIDIDILFEDRHCLVVNKPSRMLTASDKTGDETLLSRLRDFHGSRQEAGKKGYLVPLHFLDRPVSGVVMFAVSSKAASRLSEQFRSGTIEKVYDAIVEGVPIVSSSTIKDHLLKNPSSNIVTVVPPGTPGAKACSLEYEVLMSLDAKVPGAPPLSWLEVRPHTGRSHQIRVQLSSRGWPICGDRKYGALSSLDGSIALHARRVTFQHPVSKESVTVEAPRPSRWSDIWSVDWPASKGKKA